MMVEPLRVGFIGLGAMGFGMASNLLSGGMHLNTIANRNRDPVDKLIAGGATEHSSIAELVQDSDAIISCLPNSKIVESVISEMIPVLQSGQLLIDTGTSSLTSTEQLANTLAQKGVLFAEAPLTGGIQQATDGELGALVGSDEAVFPKVEELLKHCCSTVQYFGPVGAGGKAKFVNNYMVCGIAALVFEAFHIADLNGTDWDKLYDVVIRGSADSGVFRRVIGNARNGDFGGYVFDVNSALKDMTYITEMNASLGRNTDLNKAVLDLFVRAEADGYGDVRISELLRPDIRTSRGGV